MVTSLSKSWANDIKVVDSFLRGEVDVAYALNKVTRNSWYFASIEDLTKTASEIHEELIKKYPEIGRWSLGNLLDSGAVIVQSLSQKLLYVAALSVSLGMFMCKRMLCPKRKSKRSPVRRPLI